MSRMGCVSAFCFLLALVCLAASPASTRPAEYVLDLHDTPVGKVPDDLMVLNGEFSVREADGQKFLEVPADPLDTFGLLFGPAEFTAGDVSGRIWAQSSGKRFPEFGIGSNDTGGYKLWMLPGQRRMEIHKGDDVLAIAPYAWRSGTWTRLRLHTVAVSDKRMRIEGKVWADGASEPAEWSITIEDSIPPSAGRVSAWGVPYAGSPIRFNELRVRPNG